MIRYRDDCEILDLARILDNALGDAEADCEILEIGRGRHHHGEAQSIISERDSSFLGNGALARARLAVLPSNASHVLVGGKSGHPLLSLPPKKARRRTRWGIDRLIGRR